MKLYKWQEKAIDFFFKNNHEAIFEVATGTGKTFCAIQIIKRILEKDPDAYLLIVVPKNVILETGWYKELSENGISLRDIGVYYGKIKEYSRITITNMQNLHRIPFDSTSDTGAVVNMFNGIILDELHNYGTEAIMKYLRYPFKYKLGLSATMDRMDGNHWKLRELFNWNTFTYSAKEALEDGVLNNFDYTKIGVVMDSDDIELYEIVTNEINAILNAVGGFDACIRGDSPLKRQLLILINKRKKLVNNYYKKFDIVKNLCIKNKDDKIIIFNQFNDQTNKCYWMLSDNGIKSCVVHSGIPNDQRHKNIRDFKNNVVRVVLTSKVLDEGYNMPDIDCGIIMANDSSVKQVIQRMGRVLRKTDKRSKLYQVYCIGTIEEEYMQKSVKLFKELSTNYEEIVYDNKKSGEI